MEHNTAEMDQIEISVQKINRTNWKIILNKYLKALKTYRNYIHILPMN